MTRDVHGVAHEAAVQRRGDLLGDDHSRAVLRLLGGRRQMGRRDDIVELEQRARVRLRRERVERGSADRARLQRLEQVVLVDQRAARSVDDPDTSCACAPECLPR